MPENKNAAACDRHLPKHLRDIIADDRTETMRVSHLATADSAYMCSCGVPAHWYVRVWPVDTRTGLLRGTEVH